MIEAMPSFYSTTCQYHSNAIHESMDTTCRRGSTAPTNMMPRQEMKKQWPRPKPLHPMTDSLTAWSEEWIVSFCVHTCTESRCVHNQLACVCWACRSGFMCSLLAEVVAQVGWFCCTSMCHVAFWSRSSTITVQVGFVVSRCVTRPFGVETLPLLFKGNIVWVNNIAMR